MEKQTMISINLTSVDICSLPQPVYWRFKGSRFYSVGYAVRVDKGLVRLGKQGDGGRIIGPIVDPAEIEVKA